MLHNSRNNKWLKSIAQKIWFNYFSDISPTNDLRVKFGRCAKWQLGCIRQSRKAGSPSVVTLNGYFKNPKVPQYVIEGVLAHEFSHYLHGFSSCRPQLFRYPHRGGIIKKELKQRGLADLEKRQNEWIKQNWQNIINVKYQSKNAK